MALRGDSKGLKAKKLRPTGDSERKSVRPADAGHMNHMYYAGESDRSLMKDSDLGGMDSGDPLQSDGYAKETELPGEPGSGPKQGFSVQKKNSQKTGLASMLRKRGAPNAS